MKKAIIVTILVALLSFFGGFALKGIMVKDTQVNTVEEQTKQTHSFSEIKKIIDTYGDLFVDADSFSKVSKENLRMRLFNNTFHREKKDISLDEFNKMISESAFNNVEIEAGDIGFDTGCSSLILYKYNKDSKKFEYQELPGHDCGFGSFPVTFDTIVDDYKFENNQYVVTEYAIYYRNVPEDKINFYGSREDAENGSNSIDKMSYNSFKSEWNDYKISPYISESMFEKHKNKLTKIIYTFEDKNGILTLTNVTK